MDQPIELPAPLVSQICDYAKETDSSPAAVVEKAWRQFLLKAEQNKPRQRNEAERAKLLAEIQALSGSLKLPEGKSDKELIEEARLEKYGPF